MSYIFVVRELYHLNDLFASVIISVFNRLESSLAKLRLACQDGVYQFFGGLLRKVLDGTAGETSISRLYVTVCHGFQ